MRESNYGKIPTGKRIKVFDVGVGFIDGGVVAFVDIFFTVPVVGHAVDGQVVDAVHGFMFVDMTVTADADAYFWGVAMGIHVFE